MTWSIWRERIWLWAPAALLLLVGIGLLAHYRLEYSGEGDALQRQIDTKTSDLEAQVVEREAAEGLLERAQTNRTGVEVLFTERFSTEAKRFTKVAGEIRDLVQRSGLHLAAIAYPEDAIEDFGLVKRSFAFTVEGTYAQLRRLVNLLELTPSFVTLEQVDVQDLEGDQLRFRLDLSTLFVESAESSSEPRSAS